MALFFYRLDQKRFEDFRISYCRKLVNRIIPLMKPVTEPLDMMSVP